MKSVYLTVILGLFVLPTPASAEAPPTYPRLVNPAPGEEKALAEKLAPKTTHPLHETGARLIKDFVCRGAGWCVQKHGDRLTKAAHKVIDVCLEDPDIPRYMCLALVATISNEGGGKEHPSCAGLPKEEVLACDKIWDSHKRRRCFVKSAKKQGKGRVKRAARCNDRGTSRGPFQMKRARIRQCQKILGKTFNPFSLEESARCTAQLIKRAAAKVHRVCGRIPNPWLVGYKRLTRGVIRKIANAVPRQFVADPKGGPGRWIPAQKAEYEQICTESRYGRRGLRYYRACGERCRLASAGPDPTQTFTRTQ